MGSRPSIKSRLVNFCNSFSDYKDSFSFKTIVYRKPEFDVVVKKGPRDRTTGLYGEFKTWTVGDVNTLG